MDPKNELELDITMETKCHYKLRSSLKKRKSRNPLGSLDITEVPADTTLAPPPRRVSFAASNYVKPFMDDPEKNTIWDNTYEEEVNNTDSTKSENTNHTNLSEHKSQYQEITNVDVQKKDATNIYGDQVVEDMEVSCFDQTMINDERRNVLSDSNLDLTPCVFPNMDVKNTTELSKETTFNMELTCNWKNTIIQSSVAHGEISTNQDYLLRNSTVRQEQDMSMTCCFKNVEIQDNKSLHTSSARMVRGKEEFLPDQSEMEFTCTFPNNVLETVNQHRETAAETAKGVKIDKENITTDYIAKEVFIPDQSEMDFTCAFSNKILEGVKPKGTESNSVAMTTGYTNVDKENVATICAKTETVFLPNQSEMEFTCAFSNNMMERVKSEKTEYNFPATIAEAMNVKDKENIITDYPKKKEVCLPDDSGMEFTCAFPSNILEKVEQSKQAGRDAKTPKTLVNVIDKENLVPVFSENKIYLPDQSGMEFTCSFPSNILETVKRGNIPKMVEGLKDEDKGNKMPVIAENEKVFLPDKSGMDFTCAFSSNILETVNQSKGTGRDLKVAKGLNVEDKENLPVFAKSGQVFLPNHSTVEFTCAFPNSLLESANQSKGIEKNTSPVVTETVNLKNNENVITADSKNEKVFLSNQSGMEFTSTFSGNTKNTLNFKGTASNSSTDKENIAIIYDKKEKIFLADESKLTCELQHNILESGSLSKGTKNNLIGENVEDKKDLVTVYAKEEKMFFSDQSEMEISYGSPNRTSRKETPINNTQNDSIRMQGVEGIVQNKKNLLSDDMTGYPSEIYHEKEKSLLHQSDMKYTSSFSDKILEITGQPKKNRRLKTLAISKDIENKNVLLPNQDQILDTESYSMKLGSTSSLPANYKDNKIEFSKASKEHSTRTPCLQVKEVCGKELTRTDNQHTENFEVVPSTLNNCEFKKASNLLGSDVNNLNTLSNKYEFRSKSAPRNESSFDVSQGIVTILDPPRESILKNVKATQSKPIFVESKVTTEFIKPVKVREFGNIPVAVDVTDLSIDQNIIDHVKPVIDISRQDYGLKENTYTVSVKKPEKKSIKISGETFVYQKGNASQRDNVTSPKKKLVFSNDGENIIFKTQSRDPASTQSEQNMACMMNRSQNETNLKINKVESLAPENIASSTKPKSNTEISLSEQTKPNNSEVMSRTLDFPNKCKENVENKIGHEVYIAEDHIIKIASNVGENKGKNKEKETMEGSIVEERSLIDSMEASILINSLTLLDEQEQESVRVSFSPNKMHDASVQKEESAKEKVPVTKVIYSEPMKVKPFNEEFPSMQTSGMNPFNFTSIASMEDTQQLIQATFSKPSFIKTDQFDDKWHSGFVPEPSMLETTGNIELNKTDTTPIHNDTLKTESIFKNIHKKLVRCEFQPVNYQEIADSVRIHHEIRDKMEKLLLNFKFPEIHTFSLQEKIKKMSLGNVSSDGSSNESMLEVLDGGEDNCNKSVLVESNLSLHDKIVNVCERSNNQLKIKHFEGCSYIFSTIHECVLIYVHVHPLDGRVTESKAASSLDDSMDILNHFLVKNILDKLKQSTLKSYLGPYYDILSLLDHICLTVDEVMEFYFEFLSLQELYPTLKIHSDYSISLEILHSSPPIWWTIRLNMASVTKIHPESLQLESKWDRINEEHIKQILINICEGVECLRSFISNVYKYFERTQLRFKVQQE